MWLLACGYLLWVGYGPELAGLLHMGMQPPPGGKGLRARGLALAWSRLAADPRPLAGAGATALLTFAIIALFIWSGYKQRESARTAERRAVTYLVTLAREEQVATIQMREFWLGVRQGLTASFWQRLTGRAPYVVWCDNASAGARHQAATYVRVVGDSRARNAVLKALQGLNSSVQVQEVAYPRPPKAAVRFIRLRLARPSIHPIRTEFDPEVEVRAVLGKYLHTSANLPWVEIAYRLRPAASGWAVAAERRAAAGRRKQDQSEWRGEQEQRNLASRAKVPHAVIQNWHDKLGSDQYGWDADITIAAAGSTDEADNLIKSIGEHYFGFFSGDNRWLRGAVASGAPGVGYAVRYGDKYILSPAECAAVCHLPRAQDVPGLAASSARTIEAPKALWLGELPMRGGKPLWLPQPLPTLPPVQAVTRKSVFGYQGSRLVGISRIERFKGAFFLGPPGVGKSWALANLALGDACSGDGAAVIEPHGDLTRAILARLPRELWPKVIYFDPQELYERGRAATLNVMEGDDPVRRPALQAMIMEVFRSIAGTNWTSANRMQSLLESAIACVLETVAEPTLRDLFRFITNPGYRKSLEQASHNPLIREYWSEYFDKVDYREQQNMIGPLVTRITKTMLNPYAANIVSGKHSTIDLRDVLENGKILLVNLPGAGQSSGDPTMALIGMLMIVRLRIEAARRLRLDEAKRRAFYLTIDEAHLLVSRDIEDMLAQFRKLRVALTLAFQSLGQIEKGMLDVLLATIANRVIFRGEGTYAEQLAEELLNQEVKPTDVAAQPNFSAYVRLMQDSTPQRVCTLETLPLAEARVISYPRTEIAVGRAAAEARYPVTAEAETLLGQVRESLTQSEQAYWQQKDTKLRFAADRAQQAAIVSLTAASEATFGAVWQAQEARDRYLSDWLLAHPGACRNQSELIKMISMLRYSRPAALVIAEARREDARIEAKTKKRSGVTSAAGGQSPANQPAAATPPAQVQPQLSDYHSGGAAPTPTPHVAESATPTIAPIATTPLTMPPTVTPPAVSEVETPNAPRGSRPRRPMGWGAATEELSTTILTRMLGMKPSASRQQMRSNFKEKENQPPCRTKKESTLTSSNHHAINPARKWVT